MVSTEALDGALEAGIGLTVAMQSFTMLDRLVPEGTFGPVGEIRLVPDLDTFAVLPYAPKSGRLLVDMVQLDRTPWPVCPRTFLKQMMARARERGLQMVAAFENEFYLARVDNEGRFIPFDRSNCFSSIGMDAPGTIIIDIVEALEKQGIAVQQYYPELGPGQQEISVQHTEALRAADQQVVVRETVRGVAGNHGVYASFAPKPFPDQAGSGCHIHFSLWDTAGRQNLLSDPSAPYGISPLGYHVIGGVEHGIVPPTAVTKDPAVLSEEERQHIGAHRLPLTLDEALVALDQDEVLRDALGQPLATEYLLVKRAEWDS